MSSFRSIAVITSIGASVVITAIGVRLLYFKLADVAEELRSLTDSVAALRNEVSELKKAISRRRRPRSGYSAWTTSSGDDEEDIFLDAHGGYSDMEPESVVEVDNDDILNKTDQMFDNARIPPDQIYQLLYNNRSKYLTDPEFYWRLCKAMVQLAGSAAVRGDTEQRKKVLYEAKEYATSAVLLGENSADCHKWYAIILGQLTDYESTANKIQNSFLIKEHIEKALTINPLESTCLYMLGRWCYSVAMLTWVERRAASALYATPPTATIDEALEHFQKVEKIAPGRWKGNQLYIAKCLLQQGQQTEAVSWLEKAASLPSISGDDHDSQKEIQNLLEQYGNR